MHRLLPCPSCGRHVKVTEAACPFCATDVTQAFGAAPAARVIPNGLSRAALAAIAAASIGTVACGGESVAVYGAPAPTGGTVGSGGVPGSGGAGGTGGATATGARPGTGGTNIGGAAPAYGLPPAGGTVGTGGRPATGGSAAQDAGDDAMPATGGIGAVPPYGIPPIPDYGAPPPPSKK